MLLDKIATGGMGEIYLAKLTGAQGFEKLMTIKKVLPHLLTEDILVGSFIDEAKLAAHLNHQNIVQIYDFGSTAGTYFIAMEYLFGKDLRVITNKSKHGSLPISIEHALFITARVCDGLDYAHNLKDFHGNSLNIIHRDICPQNIVVTYDGLVKIIDFGIAKAASQDTTTQAGTIKGKVAYMSPEQAHGQPIDHRSDIFPIGILLYEMVTRKRMFEGETFQVFAKVREGDFEPAENIVKDLPPEIYEILHRALAKSPEERYQSAGEMLSDIEECMANNSFRPTVRSLAGYLNTLFKEESVDEKNAIRKAAAMEIPEQLQKEIKKDTGTAVYDEIEIMTPGRGKKRALFFGAAGVVILIILILVSVISKGPDDKTIVEQAVVQEPVSGSESPESVEVPDEHPSPEEKTEEPAALASADRMLEEGRFAKAADLYAEVLAENPLIREKIAGQYARALNGEADKCLKTDPDKAEALLKKSLELDQSNARVYYLLGKLYGGKKNYAEAVKKYEKSLKLDPDNPDTLFNLGYIYAVTKNYENAAKLYGKVVELTPPYLDEALFNLAMVQDKLGLRDESILNLEKAISVNPDNELAKKYLKRSVR